MLSHMKQSASPGIKPMTRGLWVQHPTNWATWDPNKAKSILIMFDITSYAKNTENENKTWQFDQEHFIIYKKTKKNKIKIKNFFRLAICVKYFKSSYNHMCRQSRCRLQNIYLSSSCIGHLSYILSVIAAAQPHLFTIHFPGVFIHWNMVTEVLSFKSYAKNISVLKYNTCISGLL